MEQIHVVTHKPSKRVAEKIEEYRRAFEQPNTALRELALRAITPYKSRGHGRGRFQTAVAEILGTVTSRKFRKDGTIVEHSTTLVRDARWVSRSKYNPHQGKAEIARRAAKVGVL